MTGPILKLTKAHCGHVPFHDLNTTHIFPCGVPTLDPGEPLWAPTYRSASEGAPYSSVCASGEQDRRRGTALREARPFWGEEKAASCLTALMVNRERPEQLLWRRAFLSLDSQENTSHYQILPAPPKPKLSFADLH